MQPEVSFVIRARIIIRKKYSSCMFLLFRDCTILGQMMDLHSCPNAGSSLPIRAMRLMVPPLQLLTASMWRAAEKGDVMDYGTLGEIVASLTETVPELLNERQRTQLVFGLRAKMILELCRIEQTAELQTIQPHLDKILALPQTSDRPDSYVTETEVTKSSFHDLVHNLLKDPVGRQYFFQEVFPVEFGPKYDCALQKLMWEFLSRLEQLLPVPDLKQRASWLGAAPSILNECVESVCHSPHLKTIMQQHQKQGHLNHNGSLSLSTGNCIISSLSLPPSVTTTTRQTEAELQSEFLDRQVIYEEDMETECIVVTDYAEVELGTSVYTTEGKDLGFENSADSQKQLQNQPVLHPKIFEGEHLGGELELVCEESEKRNEVLLVTVERKPDNTEVEVECEDMGAVCEDMKSIDSELKIIYEKVEIVKNVKIECEEPVINLQNRNYTEASLAEIIHEERGLKKESSEIKDMNKVIHNPGTEMLKKPQTKKGPPEKNELVTAFPHRTLQLNKQDITSLPSSEYVPSLPMTRSRMLLRSNRVSPQSDKRDDVLKNEADVTMVVPLNLLPEASKKRELAGGKSAYPVKSLSKESKGETVAASLVFGSDKIDLHQHMSNLHPPEDKKHRASGDYGPEPPPSEPATLEAYSSQSQNTSPSNTRHTPNKSSKQTRSKTCPVCDKTFTRATDMRRHLRSHTGERPYKCTHCGKSFLYSFDLKRHQRRGAGSSQFQCCVCGEGFGQEDGLKTHRSVAHGADMSTLSNDTGDRLNLPADVNDGEEGRNQKGQHKCLKCQMTFSQVSQMKRHQLVHSDDDPLRCHQCWKKCPNPDALSRHMQTHIRGQPFQCSVCKMNFTQFICLRQHYLMSHKEEGAFLCSHCPKGFSRLSNLIKHQRTHTGERPYQCSHCSKRFTQVQILTRHERIHTGERPFLCSDCGKSFLSSGELSKHLQCHSEARPFPCPQCDKMFKANRFLKKHLQTHTGERPFPCTHCGKRFAKSTDLTRHNRMHTGERPHSCSQCGKTFLTYAEVVKHQRYHTGERPFKCAQCGKTFTQSCYLTVHMRIHTGERPYRCTVCGRSFNSTTPLRRHMLTHTGEKPFKCSECGKAYNRLHLLRSHEQSHAGNTC